MNSSRRRILALLGALGSSRGLAQDKGTQSERVPFGILTGAPSGTYYPLGGMIAQLLVNRAKVNGRQVLAFAETGAGSVANTQALARKEADSAFVAADVLSAAFRGTGQFQGAPLVRLRALGALFPEVVQVLVRADSPVQSIRDLRSRTIASGPPGSSSWQMMTDILAVHGVSRIDLTDDHSTFPEAGERLRSGSVSAVLVMAGAPTGPVAEVARVQPLRLLPIANEGEEITRRKPWVIPHTLPANTYRGQSEPTQTLGMMAIWATHDALPDEVAFEVTRAVFDNVGLIAPLHVQARAIRAANAVMGVPLPFHAGAGRYFRDKGLSVS